jgi:hypothetical protein
MNPLFPLPYVLKIHFNIVVITMLSFVSSLSTLAVESQETAVKCSVGITVIWHSCHMKMLCSTLVMLAILVDMSVTAGPMKGMGLSLR